MNDVVISEEISTINSLLSQRIKTMETMIRVVEFVYPWKGFELPLTAMIDDLLADIEIKTFSDSTTQNLLAYIENLKVYASKHVVRTKPTAQMMRRRSIALLRQLEEEQKNDSFMNKILKWFRIR